MAFDLNLQYIINICCKQNSRDDFDYDYNYDYDYTTLTLNAASQYNAGVLGDELPKRHTERDRSFSFSTTT